MFTYKKNDKNKMCCIHCDSSCSSEVLHIYSLDLSRKIL